MVYYSINPGGIALNVTPQLTFNIPVPACYDKNFFFSLTLRAEFIDNNCNVCDQLFTLSSTQYQYFANKGQRSAYTSSLNIEDEAADQSKQLSLFPNPNTGNFKIVTQQSMVSCKYDVADEKGAVILQGLLNGKENEVNASSLKPGNYFVRLYCQGKKPITKVIVILPHK